MQDESGKSYALADKTAVQISTDIGGLKSQLKHATDNGLVIKIGQRLVKMTRGCIVTDYGIDCRRRFRK